MKILIALIILVAHSYARAGEAQEIIKKAQELSFSRADSALALLDEAYSLDPNPDFIYQKAVILYGKYKFNMASKELLEIKDSEGTRDEYFRLLGACYDLLGKKKQARYFLNEGLMKFPKSAKLYYEMGVIELGESRLNEALKMWGKGIYSEPAFPGNYYYLAKYSKNKVNSILFSEFYLNLSATEGKTKEISKYLYSIYEELISQYAKNQDINLYSEISPEDEDAMKFAFERTYKKIMLECLKELSLSNASLENINKLRTRFLEKWLDDDYNIHYPNAVIDYWELIQKMGYFHSYNYLILSEGNRSELDTFIQKNKKSLQEYARWSMSKPFEINDLNSFYPNKFED